MIKTPKDYNELTVSVFLKDGGVYLKKDTTNAPMGEHETVICFWDDSNTIITIPLTEVKMIRFHLTDKNEDNIS
jgi:hypothetical protein